MTLQYRITPDERRRKLRELIDRKRFAPIVETHNGLNILTNKTAQIHEGEFGV